MQNEIAFVFNFHFGLTQLYPSVMWLNLNLFIIDEFACLLTFSTLVTNMCSSGIPKVHKEEW